MCYLKCWASLALASVITDFGGGGMPKTVHELQMLASMILSIRTGGALG